MKQEDIKVNLEASIIGYHNPLRDNKKEVGDFLLSYLKRQSRIAWKQGNSYRAVNIVQVLRDWDKWVERIKILFPRTFK
jgi:hypothetical protein